MTFNIIHLRLVVMDVLYMGARLTGMLVRVPKGCSVMTKGLRSVQQVSSSSQGVHLL